jgi:MOSC domain-containing protein YiiM
MMRSERGGNFVAVTSLFIKLARGKPMEPVSKFEFSPQGIATGLRCSPLRQVLITSRSASRECGLAPGDLRENIEIDADHLYDLPSGTVIRVGEALIRLTFHCEPCKKIRHLVAVDRILHKRGYLGSFLNSGAISVGDAVTVTEQKLEAIPYAVKDRIRWYFARRNAVPGVNQLLDAVGLPAAYARAIPRLVANMSRKVG